jgi:hypothetical protein
MTIPIYLDHNVWHFLFARNLDLAIELPPSEFSLCITREAEFEIAAIPPDQTPLKCFIEATITRCRIPTDTLFGFYDPSLPPEEQRYGGWGVGRWMGADEAALRETIQTTAPSRKPRPTKLYRHEADLAVGTRSAHSVVLTLDAKPGPLRRAGKSGGRVVLLNDFDRHGISLADFIRGRLNGGFP